MPRTTRSAYHALSILLLLALALSACGGRSRSATDSPAAIGDRGAAATPASASAELEVAEADSADAISEAGGGGTGAAPRAAPGTGADEQAAAQGDAGSAPGGAVAASSDSPTDAAQAGRARQSFDRLLVRTHSISMQVENVPSAVSRTQAVASGVGGYVLGTNVREQGKYSIADITLTVPADRFDDALGQLRGLAKKVVSESGEAQDVTEEYVDLRSRQRSLEATEASFLTLLRRAKTIGEVLSVQRELTKVQTQIEEIKGRVQYLGNRSSMSRIVVSMRPVPVPVKPSPKPAVATPDPAWSAFRVAGRAWDASLAVLQGFATVLISALVFGWWLVPVGLVGVVWYRRMARSRQTRRLGTEA